MSDQPRNANLGYPDLGPIHANKPREIGICDRVIGLDSGLSDLYGRLANVLAIVDGNPPAGAAGTKTLPCGSGLPGSLSSAEANLRGCMELLSQLNAKL